MLRSVYEAADGLKLLLGQTGDSVIQEMFYNGWSQDHYVSNLFVFSSSRVVLACVINVPGSMHDSSIAEWGNLYHKLEQVFHGTGGQVVVDSSFSKDSTLSSLNQTRTNLLPARQEIW